MRRFLQYLALTALALIVSVAAKAAVTAQSGWFEAAYAKWEAVSGASGYQVFIKPQGGTYTQLDEELVRQYPGYFRADAVGLKAGSYVMKIVPVIGGKADESKAMETSALNVIAHDRNGFAHYNRSEGVGAYNNDGTLKSNARVIYVTANNAKTVSLPITTSTKGEETRTGLQNIIAAFEKGLETRPLAIRIVGTVKAADMDAFGSSAEGLQIKGKSGAYNANITLEGIGNDAAIHGFGILCRSIASVEFRNFAIMLCMDDCLSLDTDNKNIWIHNMDFFYGGTGGAADQAKGDGTVDIKGKSSHVTVSYNHFFDSGKCSLGGMKSETTDCWMTYHHNWFDHSDSRHPRIRTAFYHVYNNYYDGVSKYGVGVTCGGSSFVENNYFRNCKYPLLISKQGTDAEGDGTFSGEPGGVNKAFNNFIKGERKIQYYDGSQTDGKWDAVQAQNRDEAVSATAFSGGTSYNNTADAEARKAVPASAVEAPDAARATIQKLAGRCEQGDFKWTFNNSTQDENYGVITDLKNAIVNYKSTLIGFADGSEISNGGASSTVDGGDGKGIDPDVNEGYVPSYGGGGGTITSGEYVIGSSSDYFWTIADNADATNALIAYGTITLDAASTFQTTKNIAGSDGAVYSDKVGSLQIAKSTGTATFYWADGIQSLSLYLVRTGSFAGEIQTSDDGTTFTKLTTYNGNKGIKELSVTPTTPCKYIRITNTTTGGLNIQGIKIAKPGEGGGDSGDDDPIGDERSKDATASFTLDGEDIVTAGSYTRNVAFDATETEYTVVVTPAEKATIKSVTGATEKAENTYSIAAPAAGKTATATFTIVAENETTTKTYTFNIVKGSDPATLPQEEICYFIRSTKSPSMPNVVVTGNYSNSKGSVTYNGTTYTDCVKMESSTSIKVTPTSDCNVILKFGEAGKKFKLDGTAQTTDAGGSYTFEGKQGTTYTITKGDAINLYLIIFQKAGGTTDPDPVDPDPTPATQINFPVSTDGITASGTTTMSATEITFANGFFSKGATEAENKYDNGIIMKVEGGFKAGDVVTVAGTINVKTSDAKYDTKILTTVMLAKATAGIKAETVEEEIYTFQPFANTAEGKTATDQTYTLVNDYDELWLVRSGGTKAIVTKLIVTRSTGTGISDIETIVLDSEAMYDISGRKIAAPVKGQLYIKGGKKYIGE